MIKIKIQGGLGNQLFQYALARALKEKNRNKEIILDLSYYLPGGVAKRDTPRGYELDKYNIYKNIKIDYGKTPKKYIILEKLLRRTKKESAFIFYKKYLNPKENSCLIGFWQSEKYFKDIEEIVRKEFTLKNRIEDREDGDLAKKNLYKILNSNNSICVNVRRGDYVTNSMIRMHHGLISKEYFIKGVEYIFERLKSKAKDLTIFVVSDDIYWCKENLKDLEDFGKVIFMPKEISATDTLYLISKCSHNVIANSSFCWWGAWLNENKDKIVIAPKYWMRKKMNTKDIIPESWIKLENKFY